MSAILVPTLTWAQRKTLVYINIVFSDGKDIKVDIEKSKISFSGELEDKKYAIEFELFGSILPENSTWSKTDRLVSICLKKEEITNWPRLTKVKNLYKTNIQIDWEKWVDSDGDDYDDTKPKEKAFDYSDMYNDGFNLDGNQDQAAFGDDMDSDSSSDEEEKQQ
ncbi:hypothetical protein WA158_004599 [Blastocystis sp. Blastoise]